MNSDIYDYCLEDNSPRAQRKNSNESGHASTAEFSSRSKRKQHVASRQQAAELSEIVDTMPEIALDH